MFYLRFLFTYLLTYWLISLFAAAHKSDARDLTICIDQSTNRTDGVKFYIVSGLMRQYPVTTVNFV